MAGESVLKLTVKSLSNPSDSFEVEISEDETVDSLVVCIFSMRPDLGEELRIVHKQRQLKPEAVLKDAGVVSGDLVVAARMPSKAAQPQPPAADAAKPAEVPVAAADEAKPEAAPADPVEDAKAVETPTPPAEEAKTAEAPAAAPEEAKPEVALATPMAEVQPVEAPVPAADEATPAEAPAAAAEEVKPEATLAAPTNEAKPADAPAPAAEEAKPAEDMDTAGLAALPEDGPPSATILELARRLETGQGDAHPGEVVAALRRAAARVEALEGNLSEFGRALQLTHMLSGQVLQGFGGLSGDASQARSPVGGGGREEEAPKSFLVKKGDAELQEQHRLAAAMRPSGLTRQTSGGSSNGGALSTASTPMTKDEMDKARKARLEMLEAQQAEKKREMEEGESKSRAREAMFNPIQPGPSKPLGKF
jgi:outer membrane biosynthesis protein TonB